SPPNETRANVSARLTQTTKSSAISSAVYEVVRIYSSAIHSDKLAGDGCQLHQLTSVELSDGASWPKRRVPLLEQKRLCRRSPPSIDLLASAGQPATYGSFNPRLFTVGLPLLVVICASWPPAFCGLRPASDALGRLAENRCHRCCLRERIYTSVASTRMRERKRERAEERMNANPCVCALPR
ncbi:hypothetical protein BIW11_13345, partial [Tropilaelaps mercedesae]